MVHLREQGGSPMRALVLNASPRKTGTVAAILQEIADGASARYEVDLIHVHDLTIRPCVGCMRCRAGGECVLPRDDGHEMARRISQADALIVGTPTYWGNMAGPLKVLFDRIVPVMMGETAKGMPLPRQKGKPAVIVTACTTPSPADVLFRQSAGALRAVREVLHYGGYRIVGCVRRAGSKGRPEVPVALLRKARRLGSRL